jgi:hypothetical protein
MDEITDKEIIETFTGFPRWQKAEFIMHNKHIFTYSVDTDTGYLIATLKIDSRIVFSFSYSDLLILLDLLRL